MIGPLDLHYNKVFERKLSKITQTAICKKISDLAGIAYFEIPEFHDTIHLASQAAQSGPPNILREFTGLVQGLITMIGFLGVLIVLSPMLAGLVCLAAFPQLIIQLEINRQRFRLASDISPEQRRASYFRSVLSGISAAKELRLFDLSDYFLEKFLRVQHAVHKHQNHQSYRELQWQLFLNLFSSTISSGAFVFVVIQGFRGNLTLGDITLYSSAVSSVLGALYGIARALSGLNEKSLFFTNYQKLMDLPQPIKITSRTRPTSPLSSGIIIDNVSFRYTNKSPWVLRNVNLNIAPGRCTALVGLNGVGKTTLVKLITRLYDPTEGKIMWNGINIAEFDPSEYRERIGAIYQDFMHYELSAMENIGLGDVSRIDNIGLIKQAAEKAGIHDVIEKLPQGYQTTLSRRLVSESEGAELSIGEWQKIAIARMLMRDADFLILDEPTSSLDAKSEYDVFCQFAKLISERTCLLISHRFSTVKMADTIAVMEDGKITDCASHEELISKKGSYSQLYKLQTERY